MQRVELEKNHASIWGKKKIPDSFYTLKKVLFDKATTLKIILAGELFFLLA
jgi:hypothetical protein